ncbi:MAG: type 2 isopentenyl-diphosphate Delta-isomerase [Patulibacter minatonensis]
MSAPSPTPAAGRKADHLRIAARDDALHRGSAGFDHLRLRHRALPGRDLTAVELRTDLLGHQLEAPLIVSAMTGGTDDAAVINARLARAAARHGIGLVLGSGRPLLDDPTLLRTYVGSDRPPLLLANLGAPQLATPNGVDDAERLVDLLGADALSIHLNPLQEAVQPEGEPWFARTLDRIAEAVQRLAPLPVTVKEVGFGLHERDVRDLIDAGVAGVDVAGAGGTNWALVEGQRDARSQAVAQAFADWGTPTVEATLGAVKSADGRAAVIASGGVTDGVQAAMSLALGATAAGLARTLLLAAQADRVDETIDVLIRQLRIATWLTGSASSAELHIDHIEVRA